MLTVHHLGVSQSDRVVWLCEELGIPYDLKIYDRDPVTRLAPPAYKALHASETAPVVTDGDMTLAESGAIVEYILARYGEGRLSVPPDSRDYPAYLYWLHYANGSFMPAGMVDLVLGVLGLRDQEAVQPLRARADRGYALAEKRLGEAHWFAGDTFTAADIMMLFPLTTMRVFAPRDLAPYPNIRAYLARVAERPAYQRACKKADPDLAPLLT
jgi:glutathione S-transferase